MTAAKPIFVDTKGAVEMFGLGRSTLKILRLGDAQSPPLLVYGTHWHRVGDRKILYNVELLEDFLNNQGNLAVHQHAIETYMRELPSSKIDK